MWEEVGLRWGTEGGKRTGQDSPVEGKAAYPFERNAGSSEQIHQGDGKKDRCGKGRCARRNSGRRAGRAATVGSPNHSMAQKFRNRAGIANLHHRGAPAMEPVRRCPLAARPRPGRSCAQFR